MGELKKNAASGFLWTATEKFGSQIVQLILGIILARLLEPSDYGLIGMLTIFTAISNTVLDCGFSNALIQKKDRNDEDFSTVFIVNVALGILLYSICYIASPWIADFYNTPQLSDIARVMFLSLIVYSFTAVPNTKLRAELRFKVISKITITASFMAAITGVCLAYSGYGVWSLVYQIICQSLLSMIFTWVAVKWKPLLVFSTKSFKSLFNFGYKLLLSGLINTISNNIYGLLIGKCYPPVDLGYYNRALHFAEIPAITSTQILNNVNYPLLVQYQNDRERLLSVYSKLLRTPLFIIFPVLTILGAVAKPLVLILLGDKWIESSWLITILCCGFLWYPLSCINLNLLYVLGRSDLVLKLEFIKKPVMILLLMASIPFGIVGVSIGRAFYSCFAFLCNCHYTKKLLNYGFWPQFKEVLPIFIYSALAAIIVFSINYFITNEYAQLFIGLSSGFISYFLIAYINRDKAITEIKSLIKEYFHKKQ